MVIVVLFLMQVVWFAYTRSGIALIFVVLLGAMSYMLKKKIQKFNKEIAKEFEAEGKQNVILGEDVLQLNEKPFPIRKLQPCTNLNTAFL